MIGIIFESKGGTTARLVENFSRYITEDKEIHRIEEGTAISDSLLQADKFLLVLPTYENFKEQRKDPNAPIRFISEEAEAVAAILKATGKPVAAVCAGNRTFGADYGAVAKELTRLGVPVATKVELSGDEIDWQYIGEVVARIK